MTLKQRFKNSINRGTGEAYLILQENNALNISKEILHAASHNLAYDQQCERTRARYIYDLINLSIYGQLIVKSMLRLLLYKKDDDYGLNQLCEIACFYAQDGNTKARDILYKRFQKNLKPGYTYCGNKSIIELDGMDGLIRIADVIGQILQRDPEDWEDGSREQYFQEENPGINVFQRLRNAAKTNKNIQTYLDAVNAPKKQMPKAKKRARFTYALVKELTESKTRMPVALAAKELTEQDFLLLANEFMQEKDRVKMKLYLRLFGKVKFPLPYDRILEIAKEKKKKDDLQFFAIQALSQLAAKDIRKFAIEKINTSKCSEEYIGLLKLNYRTGDHLLLMTIIAQTKNKDRIETIAAALTNIYETNSTKDCKKPIEAIYEKMNCGLHRLYLIKILIANNVLSEKLRAEIRYDNNEETRRLVN